MSVRLETERLVVRPLTEADAEPLAEINADPDVMRYIGDGRPRTFEQTRERVGKAVRHWEETGWGAFAVDLAETGELIGFAALAVPEFLPEILPVVEVGWRFSRVHWGNGYAPEAARAAIGYAFDEVGLDRLVSCIHRDNAASMRVAEKLGMTLERVTTIPGRGIPCHVYELRAP